MKVSTRTLPRPQPKQRDARPPPSPRFSSEAHHTLQPLAVVGDRTLRGPSSASIPQGWSCTGRVEYRRAGARQSKHKHGLGAWSRPKTHQQTISAWFLLHMIFCIHSVLDIYIYRVFGVLVDKSVAANRSPESCVLPVVPSYRHGEPAKDEAALPAAQQK